MHIELSSQFMVDVGHLADFSLAAIAADFALGQSGQVEEAHRSPFFKSKAEDFTGYQYFWYDPEFWDEKGQLKLSNCILLQGMLL